MGFFTKRPIPFYQIVPLEECQCGHKSYAKISNATDVVYCIHCGTMYVIGFLVENPKAKWDTEHKSEE